MHRAERVNLHTWRDTHLVSWFDGILSIGTAGDAQPKRRSFHQLNHNLEEDRERGDIDQNMACMSAVTTTLALLVTSIQIS